MNVQDYINEQAIKQKEARIQAVRTFSDVVAEMEEQNLAILRAHGVKVAGDKALLTREITGPVKWAKGNGGKPFATIPTAEGMVNYFPQARHGSFIAVAQ